LTDAAVRYRDRAWSPGYGRRSGPNRNMRMIDRKRCWIDGCTEQEMFAAVVMKYKAVTA
jgi:hypothetical protein